tara:strand:- start:238 stop:489 length:252 start_codon:yes stop_codon:yes gene_type:complete
VLNRELMHYEAETERRYLHKMKSLITYMLSKRTKIYGDEKERMEHFKIAFHALADGVDCHFAAREKAQDKKMRLAVEKRLRGK